MNKLIFFLFFVILCHFIFYPSKSDFYHDITIERFDKILLDSNISSFELFKNNNNTFFEKYLSYINCDNFYNQDSTFFYLKDCLNKTYNNIYYDTLKHEIESCFLETNNIKHDFQIAFNNYNLFFQDSVNPKIIFFNGYFNYYNPFFSTGFILPKDNSYIGVALEMFLGRDHDFYKVSWLPEYLRDEFEQEYMVARSMKSFLINKYGADFWMGDRLIDYMLYWGKFHFILKSIIPNYHDTVSFGYTKKELDWCYSNEKRIWKYFLDEEKEGSSILFSSSTEYFYKYINPAGYSKGMPSESPGMIGRWLGYRIFASYMKQNTFYIKDTKTSEEILNLKMYKP